MALEVLIARDWQESLTDALVSAYRNVFPDGDSMAVKDDLGNASKEYPPANFSRINSTGILVPLITIFPNRMEGSDDMFCPINHCKRFY